MRAGGLTIAIFVMDQGSHVGRLLPLVAGLARRGHAAHVFTHPRYATEVVRAGGRFIDLLGRFPLERFDARSRPAPCRFVTYAAHMVEEATALLRALGVDLVIHDTPAVLGYVAARALSLPHVNVCAGHNLAPAHFVPWLERNPRVEVAPACHEAAALLRERHGIAHASPFLFVATQSPHLNVYAEPEAFLLEGERAPFQPIAFFGSLPAPEDMRPDGGPDPFGEGGEAGPRVYVSLGTVAFRYHPEATLGALRACAEAISRHPSARAIVSLGGAAVPEDEQARLRGARVRVEPFVDQWAVLGAADAFVTHHGLNSTHEAIFREVPMLSYPLSWDQPALARRCRELGLALPLAPGGEKAPVHAEDVLASLDSIAHGREEMRARLREAAAWEGDVIARRGEVLDRIEAVARGGA